MIDFMTVIHQAHYVVETGTFISIVLKHNKIRKDTLVSRKVEIQLIIFTKPISMITSYHSKSDLFFLITFQ